MADGFWDFFNKIGEKLGPIANIFAILTTAVAVGVYMYSLMWKRTKHHEVIEKRLIQALTAYEMEIKELKLELAQTREYDPAVWIADAKSERKSGNEEKAISALYSGYVRTYELLYEVYFEIARYHIALYPDQGTTIHLQEAQRMARIASLLDPNKAAALSLLEEIDATIIMEDMRHGHYNPQYSGLVFPDPGVYGGSMVLDADEVIDHLLDLASKHRLAGRFFIFERLSHRARSISLRELGRYAPKTLFARWSWANALSLNGLFSDALIEIDDLLPIQKQVKECDQKDTIVTYSLRARVLDQLGRYKEALQEIKQVLPLLERISGIDHPNTLNTRHLRATILDHLGCYNDALQEIEELVPFQLRLRGSDHPDTLASGILRVQILDHLGRYDEALQEIEKLTSIQVRLQGTEHSHIFHVRHLRAEMLHHIGRSNDALEEIEAILPMQMQVNGKDHPHTLPTRYLYAQVLDQVGRYDDALKENEALLSVHICISGTHHPHVLMHTPFASPNFKSPWAFEGGIRGNRDAIAGSETSKRNRSSRYANDALSICQYFGSNWTLRRCVAGD